VAVVNCLRVRASFVHAQEYGVEGTPADEEYRAEEIFMSVPPSLSAEESVLVEHAGQVARAAHRGQLDKADLPYFESHVADVQRRVVSYGGDVNEQIGALLHDVLEDTSVSEADLRDEGFPEEALVIVGLLTRKEGEPSGDYYERIRGHGPSRRVKLLGDIASNSDPARLALLPDELRLRLTEKYAEATRLLTSTT